MTAPKMLPLHVPAHAGGRSAMTCQYRCGDACSRPDANTSANSYFGDIVNASATRRSVLRASGVAAAVAGLGLAGSGSAHAEPVVTAARSRRGIFGFTPIEPTPATTDAVTVPEGFAWAPIIAWGDPITPAAPEFDFDRQSPEAQKAQAGYNCDYSTILRDRSQNRGVLVFNNEYTNDELMFRGYTGSDALTVEQLQIVMAAHGMTIVEVSREGAKGAWTYDRAGRRNRRIHTHTPFVVDGPAAGSPLLRTKADPTGRRVLGTLNNCAGGDTAWGTVLSGEENIDQYFNASGTPASHKATHDRYTINTSGRGWERADSRFDVATEPNEAHRFGWIVEVDPEDPTAPPVKHTALGRLKHEGANMTIARDGRVVVYMGDDARFEYMYRFVSHGRYRKGDRRHNKTLLSSGDLSVATFTGDGLEDGVSDGTGRWIPLTQGGRSMVPGMTVEEVLVFTRLAADKVGATKMDRPEDVQVNPVNGRVYAALTNNSKRTPSQIDEANPRANNKHGHIIEIRPGAGDHRVATFSWRLVLIAGDPNDPSTYFNGYDRSEVSPISCPDNVAFDSHGNLWIGTDGMPGTLGYNDGLYVMPLSGPHRGHLQQFLSVPVGAECTGPTITWDDRTILVSVQHPGEVDGASPENPVSAFPYRGDRQPRPAVICVFEKDRRLGR